MLDYKKQLSINSRQKLYLIVALISLTLFFYSIWEIKWVVVDITDFLGLTSHLTAAYWVGLGLITLCSIFVYLDDELKNDWVFIFILIVVGLFLFGLGVFAEENVRFSVSYYPSGEVKTVLATHHIDTISQYPLISYRCWPAFHLISAFILYMTEIELSELIKYMPLFWLTCVIFITFTIGKRFNFSSNQSFLVSFLLLSSFWLGEYYYGPQSFAFIAYLLLFLFLVTFKGKNKERLKVTLLMITTYTTLIVTHLITAMTIIISFFIQSVYKKKMQFVILFILLFIAWYLYLAPVMFRTGVIEFKEQAMNLEFLSVTETTKFSATTGIKGIVDIFRLSYLGIYVLYGAIAIILYLTRKIKNENKERFELCFCWVIGGSSLILINYGLEQFERAYMFFLIPVICIITTTFSNRKAIVMLMVLLVVLHIPAHYGSESFEQTLTTELRGATFVALKEGVQTLSEDMPYIAYYNPDFVTKPTIYYIWMGQFQPSKLEDIDHLIYSKRAKYRMEYYLGEDPLSTYVNERLNCLNLIYTNEDFKLYKVRIKVLDRL